MKNNFLIFNFNRKEKLKSKFYKIITNKKNNQCLSTIDNKDKDEIESLFKVNNGNNIKKDIVYKLYHRKQLNSENLEFILDNYSKHLNISSRLIKALMKDNNKELLELLFKKHLKFFDNEFILNLLTYYKNQTQLSDTDLYPQINDEKYKLSVELKTNFGIFNSSYYLFNACKSGNENSVRFLLEHGANALIKDKDNRTIFSFACASENEYLVKYLVMKFRNYIHYEDYLGLTPLFYACWKGNLKKCKNENESQYIYSMSTFDQSFGGNEAIVKYLVNQGADINKESKNGETPLFDACRSGKESIIKYLVEQGANINKEAHDGTTPLFYACHYGNEAAVKYLVNHGADTGKKDHVGKTPFFYACHFGNVALAKYLVDHGASVNSLSRDGSTPLFDACLYGNEAIVKFLVNHGANIIKSNHDRKTPLFEACRSGKESIVKYLIDHGSYEYSSKWSGESPLIEACQNGNKTMVMDLVKSGSNIHQTDNFGNTPLSIACRSGKEDIVKYLVNKGADVNKESKYGLTPLFNACRSGNAEIVKYLLDHGAYVDEETEEGESVIFEACRYGNETIVKYLIEYGAKINRKLIYNNGETPLIEACYYKNEAVVKCLVEHNAYVNIDDICDTLLTLTCIRDRSKYNALINDLGNHKTDIKKKTYGEVFLDLFFPENKVFVEYLLEHQTFEMIPLYI